MATIAPVIANILAMKLIMRDREEVGAQSKPRGAG